MLCTASFAIVLLLATATLAGDGPGGVKDCVCWLSAKDLERGPLAVWPDQSGSGNEFKQEKTDLQPVAVANQKTGVKAVKFSGEQCMTTGKSAFAEKVGLNAVPEEQFHVFIYAMIFKELGGGTILARCGLSNVTRSFQLYPFAANQIWLNIRGHVNKLSGLVYGQPMLIEVAWDGTTLTGTIDGTETKLTCGTDLTDHQGRIFLGNRETRADTFFKGLLFELAAFGRKLSAEETAKVREQMAKR